VKVVQERLGHRSASMTLDVHGHLFPDDEDRIRKLSMPSWAPALATVRSAYFSISREFVADSGSGIPRYSLVEDGVDGESAYRRDSVDRKSVTWDSVPPGAVTRKPSFSTFRVGHR
jgi:hypothetical protein